MLVTLLGIVWLGAVAGNTAVITPELAAFVTVVAPATVKKFPGTPANVYPAFGVSVIVAVYSLFAENITSAGDHANDDDYLSVAVTVVTGVAPLTGAITPAIAAGFITASGAVTVMA